MPTEEAQQLIVDKGGKVAKSISKNMDCLVLSDEDIYPAAKRDRDKWMESANAFRNAGLDDEEVLRLMKSDDYYPYIKCSKQKKVEALWLEGCIIDILSEDEFLEMAKK